MTTESKVKIGYWMNIFGSILSGISVLLLSIGLNWIISIERRVTAIESNRFTSMDALLMRDALDEKADKTDVPPPEVLQSISELKAAVARIEERQIQHITNH